MGRSDRHDPFAIFHAPPPNETTEERAAREKTEAQAQRVSDRIDDEINIEKAALKKQQKGVVKVLLLGQSESGKSTTLKSRSRPSI
jgi:guanine nucleotide-binding protein alpha-1 subunit